MILTPVVNDLPEDLREIAGAIDKRWVAQAKERATWARILKWLEGPQRDSVPPLPDESAEHAAKRTRIALNIARDLISQLTYLYDAPPVRESATEKQWETALYRRRYGLNAIMWRADFLARASGYAALLIRPRTGSGGDWLRVDTITRDRMCVLQRPDDPDEALAVVISKTSGAGDLTGTLLGPENYDLWTDQYLVEVRGKKIARIIDAESGHPGMIPIAWARNGVPDEGEFDAPSCGSTDLMANSNDLALVHQQYLWMCHLSRGDLVIYGSGDTMPRWHFCPDVPNYLRDTYRAEILSGGDNLEKARTALITSLELFAVSLGLPRGSIELAYQETSKIVEIQSALLQSDRSLRRDLFAYTERQVHEIGAQLISGLDPAVSVAYTEPDRPLSPSQLDARVTTQLDRGLITREEALRRYDPAITAVSARDRITAATADRVLRGELELRIAGRPADWGSQR